MLSDHVEVTIVSLHTIYFFFHPECYCVCGSLYDALPLNHLCLKSMDMLVDRAQAESSNSQLRGDVCCKAFMVVRPLPALFKCVTAIKELGYVSSDVVGEDYFSTWMAHNVVPNIQHHII